MNQLPTDLLKSLQMANEQNTTSQQPQLPHHPQMFTYPNHPQMQPYPHMMMDPSMLMMSEGGMFDESQILEEIKKLQNNGQSSPEEITTTASGNTITRQDTPVPESKPISSHKARTEYILNQATASQISPTSPSEVDVNTNNNSPSQSPTSLSSNNVINNGASSPSSSSIQKYVTNPQTTLFDPFITGPLDKKSHTYVTSPLDAKKERKSLSSLKGITAYGSDQIFTNGKCIGILDDYMVWSLKGGAIRVLNRKVGKKVMLKGHKQYVSDLQCSVNLKLASVSRDRSLIVWKIIETDEKVHPGDLRNPKEDQIGYSKLVHLTFSSDQSHKFFRRILWAPQSDKELCAITSDNQLLLLDVEQLAVYNNLIELDSDNIHTMRGIRVLSNEFAESESITDLAYSSDGKYLTCVSSFGNIYIWDRRTNMTLVKEANIYNTELINIQFCAGNESNIERYFITSSQNNFDICLWYLSPELDIELVQQVSIRPETSEKFDEKVSFNNVELDSTSSALFVSNLQYPVLFTLRLNKTPLTEQEDHPFFDFITEFDSKFPIVSVVSMTIGSTFGLFCLQTGGIHLLNIRNSQICAPNQVKTAIPMPDLVHQQSSSKEVVVANSNTGVAVRQTPNIIPSNIIPPINPSAIPQTPPPQTSSGSNFELISELKRMERSILTQMDSMIQTQTERQYEQLYKRIEKERLTRLSEERTRQKELIETISSAITNDLPDEISESILDSLTSNMSDVVNEALTQSLTDTSDSGSIKKVIQESFQTVLKSTVLPSFETSCRRMFEQISKTFERGMEELVKAPLKQYCQEVNDSTVEAVRQELKNVAQHIPAVQQPVSSNSGDVSKEQLLNMVEHQRFEEVFSLVLEKADLRLLVWLCTVIDPRLFEVDIPISQPILLTLVQQLAFDITEQTDVKLSWLEKVIIHINPIDPAISKFSAQILEGIREHLAAKHATILERGKPSDIKTIKLILHIVNSLTKDAMRF